MSVDNPELDEKERIALRERIQKNIDYIFEIYVLEEDLSGEIYYDHQPNFWEDVARLQGIDPNTLNDLRYRDSDLSKYPDAYPSSYASRSWNGKLELLPKEGKIKVHLIVLDKVLNTSQDAPTPVLDTILEFTVNSELLSTYNAKQNEAEEDRKREEEEKERTYEKLNGLVDEYNGKKLNSAEWKALGLAESVWPLRDGQAGELERRGESVLVTFWQIDETGKVVGVNNVFEYKSQNSGK